MNDGLFLPKTALEVIPNEIFASNGPENLDGLEGLYDLLEGGIPPNPLMGENLRVLFWRV